MENRELAKSITLLGLLLAIGMSSAAFILGVQAKQAASGQQFITVKGLAQKPVKADSAEWVTQVTGHAESIAQALEKLAQERPELENFLIRHGLDKAAWQTGNASVSPHYEEEFLPNGAPRQVQRGFDARQEIRITTTALDKVAAASRDFVQLRAANHPVSAENPLYLVGNLEEIKMSLIAAATQNARARAEEFVKQDGVKVGVMRSASQGAFYILPVGGEASDDSYGGVYDKSTVDKTARVVVTVVYGITQ